MTDIEDLHQHAIDTASPFYIDPHSGLYVFTSSHLLARGTCCSSSCRHCPYRSKPLSASPVPHMLHGSLDDLDDNPLDVLFWSGGKDSYLAFSHLRANSNPNLLLLTTYDAHNSRIALQELPLHAVRQQASLLRLPLLAVPHVSDGYMSSVRAALSKILNHGLQLGRLVFGDLHLKHIRDWREKHLANILPEQTFDLYFPIWHVPYEQLLDTLRASGARVTISAVNHHMNVPQCVQVGDVFDREFVNKLPPNIDAFGEKGEFHTYVDVSSAVSKTHKTQ